MKPVKLYWTYHENDIECYIRRNGRFYGFVSIKACDADCQPKGQAKFYYFEPLIPGGGMDHDTNPVQGLKAAKAHARTIVETMLADLNGVTLA
jgi:hypothetical protein